MHRKSAGEATMTASFAGKTARRFSAQRFCLAIGVSLCGIAAPHAQSDMLYEQAKLEKTVVLYGAGPPGPYKRWIEDFQNAYPGVTVAFTGGLSNTLDKKIDAQIAAKAMEADVGIFQTIQDFVRWKKAGALLFFKPEGSAAIDPAFKDEDGAFTTVSVNMVTYAYNTQHLAAAEVPKSALDFLKPVFREQLITTDPSDDDAGFMAFHTIVQKYGWDYMDKYMAQKPRFVRDGHATVSNAVAAGEMLATFDSTSTTPRLIREGKPIQMALSQDDPTPLFLVSAAIFKDAPHPNAAKLFVDWYLAPAQQSRTGAFSPRSDVAPPQGFKPLSAYNLDRSFRALLSDAPGLAALKARFAGYVGGK
jgi:ABC-type Fe3+ transport system substrate-binding protein